MSGPIDVEALDDLNDDEIEALYGTRVDWFGTRGTLVKVKGGGPYVRVRLRCTQRGCRRGHTTYIARGAPGWCYAHNRQGDYEADLRNQEFRCDQHRRQHTEAASAGGST